MSKGPFPLSVSLFCRSHGNRPLTGKGEKKRRRRERPPFHFSFWPPLTLLRKGSLFSSPPLVLTLPPSPFGSAKDRKRIEKADLLFVVWLIMRAYVCAGKEEVQTSERGKTDSEERKLNNLLHPRFLVLLLFRLRIFRTQFGKTTTTKSFFRIYIQQLLECRRMSVLAATSLFPFLSPPCEKKKRG